MTTLSIPSSWRTISGRYRLTGSHCPKEKKTHFPPRVICPSCGAATEDGAPLSGKGTLLSFTVIRVPPVHQQLQTPYIMGLIKLQEGPVITSQIVGLGVQSLAELKIGMPMMAIFRKYGAEAADAVIVYGYKFTPVHVGRDSDDRHQ